MRLKGVQPEQPGRRHGASVSGIGRRLVRAGAETGEVRMGISGMIQAQAPEPER